MSSPAKKSPAVSPKKASPAKNNKRTEREDEAEPTQVEDKELNGSANKRQKLDTNNSAKKEA